MARKKKELLLDDFYNYWLEKYHHIDLKWLNENEPELIKTSEWYKKYAVTQEQYDEWKEWAIDTLSKHFKMKKEYVTKHFFGVWLNSAPNVIEDN